MFVLFQQKIWFLSGICWRKGSTVCIPCLAQEVFTEFSPRRDCYSCQACLRRQVVWLNLVLGNENAVKVSDPKVSACSYDEKHCIGLIDEVNDDHDGVKVKFMHPCSQQNSFSGPKEMMHVFPILNVACVIGAPTTI